MDSYQRAEAQMYNRWMERNTSPFERDTIEPKQEPNATTKMQTGPDRFEESAGQRDVNFAHAIDTAHATGDPMALFEAQMAGMQMSMESFPVEKPRRIVFDAKTHQA